MLQEIEPQSMFLTYSENDVNRLIRPPGLWCSKRIAATPVRLVLKACTRSDQVHF
jgi:hypothetical protein